MGRENGAYEVGKFGHAPTGNAGEQDRLWDHAMFGPAGGDHSTLHWLITVGNAWDRWECDDYTHAYKC